MAARPSDQQVSYLNGQLLLERDRLNVFNAYLEGEQPLKYMAPALQAELGDRVTQLILNWCRLGTEAYEHRLDIEGFRLPGESSGDTDLWRIWQDNDLDELSSQAHFEAIGLSRAYAIVGPRPGETETPIITVEHPFQVIVEQDPATRQVTSGLKRWKDTDGNDMASLYGLNVDEIFMRHQGHWWKQEETVHNRNMCAVVPLVNRGRMLRSLGNSEFADILPIADAANKMATDMMISGEYHAMPRRVWFGLTEDEFVDEAGKPVPVWSRLAGREWSTAKLKGKQVDVQQFAEADLKVFHDTLRLLATLASQLLALPPHYMQFTGDNPASADAIRSSEAQLVKRVERKQRIFGGAWERVMRLAVMIANDNQAIDPKYRRLETIWRDASTPTKAQAADAGVKLYTAPPGQLPILDLRAVREHIGIPEGVILDMEKRQAEAERAAATRDPLNKLFPGDNSDDASTDPDPAEVTDDVAPVAR